MHKIYHLCLINNQNKYLYNSNNFLFSLYLKKNFNQKKFSLIFNLNIIHFIYKKLKTCINKKRERKRRKEPQEQASKKQLSAEVTSIERRIAFRVIGSRCSNGSPCWKVGGGAGYNSWEWERKIEDKEEATDSSFLKRENSREWRQFGYLAAGLFQVGCRSMFIHVKGWVVRGSGWLKDSGGGRGCNKRNGYSRAARMPSPRDDRRSVFTQQRVASYNRENAHPFRPPPPLVAASRLAHRPSTSRLFLSLSSDAVIFIMPSVLFRSADAREKARGVGEYSGWKRA